MKLFGKLLLVACCLRRLPAQNLPASTAAIVDIRYAYRGNAIIATPGQIMTVTLGGFAPKKPYGSVFRVKASGNSVNPLEGFDANIENIFGDGERRSISAPILMVEQQDNCDPLPTNYRISCWATSITLQIPWQIKGYYANGPGDPHWVTLVVSDGVSVARSAIHALISNIHILNLCDIASQLYRDDAAYGDCVPDIRTSNGRYAFPAKPGEIVTIRAYGLFGLPQQPPELNGVRPTEAIPITQQRYSIEYRWGSTDLGPPAAETSNKLEPESVELAAGEVGLYSGTNFALTLRGSGSFDTARMCVSPE